MSIPHAERKEYRAKYIREHYAKNKQYYQDKARARQAKLALYIREAKNKPCTDCKIKYPFYVMEFDHIGNDKEINLGYAANRGWSITKIDNEIKKCDVVCSNCHRERTHKRLHAPVV